MLNKEADNNPAQSQANEALKLAKKLQDLLNDLAGMSTREQLAQVAGLQELPESIERVYAYADQLRAGGVQQLQPAYAGWDPDKLRETQKKG